MVSFPRRGTDLRFQVPNMDIHLAPDRFEILPLPRKDPLQVLPGFFRRLRGRLRQEEIRTALRGKSAEFVAHDSEEPFLPPRYDTAGRGFPTPLPQRLDAQA